MLRQEIRQSRQMAISGVHRAAYLIAVHLGVTTDGSGKNLDVTPSRLDAKLRGDAIASVNEALLPHKR